MATCFSILAWRVPWTEGPGRLQSRGHKESDMNECLSMYTHTHTHRGRPVLQLQGTHYSPPSSTPPLHPLCMTRAFLDIGRQPTGKAVARALEFNFMPSFPRCGLFLSISSVSGTQPIHSHILHSGLTHPPFDPPFLLLSSQRRSQGCQCIVMSCPRYPRIHCVSQLIPSHLEPGKYPFLTGCSVSTRQGQTQHRYLPINNNS